MRSMCGNGSSSVLARNGGPAGCMDEGHTIVTMKVRGPVLRNLSYLIVDRASQRAAVVDPAWELDTIEARMRQLGVSLAAVLLTHSHFDHVNCVTPLVDRHPADVFMSEREIERYGFRCQRLQPVKHGEAIRVGGTQISCLLTPGHTAGGICYLLSDAMFSGDTVFTEGCGVCTAPGGSAEAMFESFGMLKALVAPTVEVFPGHSFGMEPGHPLRSLLEDNIYFQIERKEEFVAWRMRAGASSSFETR